MSWLYCYNSHLPTTQRLITVLKPTPLSLPLTLFILLPSFSVLTIFSSHSLSLSQLMCRWPFMYSANCCFIFLLYLMAIRAHNIPSTLDGPFNPVTVPYDTSLRGKAVDIPDTDPRLRRRVKGFEPEQISVSLSTSYDSVWISWITGLKNYTSGIIHHVRLTGLKPNTQYYYQCGDPSISAMSDISYFRTMPVSGPQSYPKRIAIVGDLGLTYNTSTTIGHLISNEPDLVLLPRWDYWGRLNFVCSFVLWFMQNLVSKIPIMVVEGNHEIEEQAGNKTFAAYSDQFKWLERDLANFDRSITPWLVAAWHPPWYSSYIAHYREAECMRVEMEELLYSYGVDIVFNGHVHAYERSNRVYNYTLDPCGPVYITVGDGGNREKMAIKHADEPGKCPEPLTTPDTYMGGFCATNFSHGPAAG
ncbi:hypothetical protein Patl1_01583 [Pistacia atlantica]|uniref:Uncharacterized protein n=1 Tax=Pistacia atlantica TaxID=434234 RepID=A0ACC1C9Y7_9ROSI|nr:hypothetical protein Patl1_01583 [Pistacia atlantica]